MDEDKIKSAFQKAKQDISKLKAQIFSLEQQISELKNVIFQLVPKGNLSKQHIPLPQQTYSENIPAHSQIPADNMPLYTFKTPNTDISTGNEGVPADRQTDQQTDRHMIFNKKSELKEVINSLENMKNELKSSFKSLTAQEFTFFLTLYQLENEGFSVDYSLLSRKLKLTESSIRDYAQKLIKKGLPLEKYKEKNKKIFLKIPLEFKKIAPLSAILSLKSF